MKIIFATMTALVLLVFTSYLVGCPPVVGPSPIGDAGTASTSGSSSGASSSTGGTSGDPCSPASPKGTAGAGSPCLCDRQCCGGACTMRGVCGPPCPAATDGGAP